MLSYMSSRAQKVCGWTGWRTPGLHDRIVLNYTRIENAHIVRKKTFNFSLCKEVQESFSFPFSLLRYFQMPECFSVKNSCF